MIQYITTFTVYHYIINIHTVWRSTVYSIAYIYTLIAGNFSKLINNLHDAAKLFI